MKLELVSHTLCPYVHRAAAMIHEKGVAFERRYIDLKAKPDWFLKISPRGKVPVLLVDGQPLFESMAIIEFLDETQPPSLLPADPFARALQRAWVEVASDLSNAQYRLFIAPTPEEQAAAAEALAPILASYEEAIASGVIAPDGFGYAHLAIASSVLRFALVEQRLGVQVLRAAPRFEALVRRLAVRPSIARTVPDDYAAAFVNKMTERGSLYVSASERRSG
ncbi:MAG TPA: glutathione S-transferase family protein [Polyangia bacterium]